jgi:hypothetical protein
MKVPCSTVQMRPLDEMMRIESREAKAWHIPGH